MIPFERRGQIALSSMVFICKKGEESLNHRFLHSCGVEFVASTFSFDGFIVGGSNRKY